VVASLRLIIVLGLAMVAAFAVHARSKPVVAYGPPPGAARYHLHRGGPPGTLELTPALQAAGFSFAPTVTPAERALVNDAVASARPEAQRLVGLVDGLVDISVGDPGNGAAGRTTIFGRRYPVMLDVDEAWRRGGQRTVNRLVLHELGHVIDDALLPDSVVTPLVAAVPTGWGCARGVTGACTSPAERFAESFAKWATGDIGINVSLGYAIPPPSPSLEIWGRPLAAWRG
jgi:hypothetical protein